jgi:hypothetical protein
MCGCALGPVALTIVIPPGQRQWEQGCQGRRQKAEVFRGQKELAVRKKKKRKTKKSRTKPGSFQTIRVILVRRLFLLFVTLFELINTTGSINKH